jgi:hypothetical protein
MVIEEDERMSTGMDFQMQGALCACRFLSEYEEHLTKILRRIEEKN